MTMINLISILRQTHDPYHKGTRLTQKWLVIAQYRASVNR